MNSDSQKRLIFSIAVVENGGKHSLSIKSSFDVTKACELGFVCGLAAGALFVIRSGFVDSIGEVHGEKEAQSFSEGEKRGMKAGALDSARNMRIGVVTHES